MNKCDVAIIGAGPYGLSAAAFLRTIRGLEIRVFGKPMSFWKDSMPKGMFLRSPYSASHICDPTGAFSLDKYLQENGNHLPAPIPLERFVSYGEWFQRRAVPNVDSRNITTVEQSDRGFQLTTVDGEAVLADRVIVAAGPGAFAIRPSEFDGLPPSLATHSTEHGDLERFAGKQVYVVGAGQSALETAALLHEVGSIVEVLVRQPKVNWLGMKEALFKYPVLGRVLYSPRDVGPAGVSRLIAHPNLFRQTPRGFQDWATRRSLNPAGSSWLIDRLKDVPIRTSTWITKAVPTQGRLQLRLSDSSESTVDHVIFATGWRVDLARYAFLSPTLVQSIKQANGFPVLGKGLESSVKGLHFLGAPSGWSFGPLARFVSGTFFSPAAVTRYIKASS